MFGGYKPPFFFRNSLMRILKLEVNGLVLHFKTFNDIISYCDSTLGTENEGYVFNSDNVCICNFHGSKEECLTQLKNMNLDFY